MSLPLAGRRLGLLTASASRQGGGVFEAVVAQAELIGRLGGEAVVFALDDSDAGQDRSRFGACPVNLAKVIGPRQIGFAPRLTAMLEQADLDCLHLHGIWMYPSRAGLIWARATERPYFISPHGMLDPWITARGRWKKALARVGYERAGWAAARALHALTLNEAADIARESGRGDAVVIANAAPVAGTVPKRARAPVIAYIGRIHPKKNLVALVQAWGRTQRPPEARLRIAGWGAETDVDDLRSAIADTGQGVEFLGPVFGQAKQELLSTARFMVLPSHSEGLPMAILEAWASATPCVMTEACNLPEGFAEGAAIRCETGVDALSQTLSQALALDEASWLGMARAAHGLAAGPFSADAIAAHWGAAYARAIEGGCAS